MTTPFVYIIRNTSNNMRYAGVKFAKGCRPSDLLTSYFTSSATVKNLIAEEIEFTIDKIIEFDSKEDAMEFEELLLKTVNAHRSKDWYNENAGRAINPDRVKETSLKRFGVENPGSSPIVREKVIKTCIKKFGAESRFESEDFEQIRLASMLKNHGVAYSMQSPELREKSKKTNLERYGVENPSQMDKNRQLQSISMSEKNKVSVQCEICGTLVNRGNYARWHGVKCKHR